MRMALGLFLGGRSAASTAALSAIGWDAAAYPLTLSKVGGVWQSDFDRSDYLPDGAIVTSYWVSTSGVNANSGLSAGLPKRSIHAAITAGNATGAPFKVTVAAGTYYREDGVASSSGTLAPTQDMILVASGGRVICPQGSSLSWPGSKDGTYTNSTIVARTNVCGVIDLANLDGNGDAPRLVRAASAAACDALPGSYAQVSGNLHVNRGDGAVASNANTRVFLSAVGCPFLISTPGKKAYVEGFDFEGGSTSPGGAVTVTTAATGVVLMMRDCSAKYAGNDTAGVALNGFGVNGSGLFVFDQCHASACTADGFNGHWTVDSNRVTHLLTIDCTGTTFGTMASNMSNNGWTIHETVTGIDLNGIYRNSRGGCVRNVGDSRMLALGTQSGPDAAGGGITPAAFHVADTAEIYAIDAVADVASPADNAATATGSGRIYLRNFTSDGGVLNNTTAMPADVVV